MGEKAQRLEELARAMIEEIREELYPNDRENVINSDGLNGGEEKIYYSRTRYINCEAKDVIDLVLSDDYLG